MFGGGMVNYILNMNILESSSLNFVLTYSSIHNYFLYSTNDSFTSDNETSPQTSRTPLSTALNNVVEVYENIFGNKA